MIYIFFSLFTLFDEPCIMFSVLGVIILSHNFIGNNFLINVL